MEFNQPIEIYVVWHPDFLDGSQQAEHLYSLFCRDYKRPFDTTLGIPVYFRSAKNGDAPLPIDNSRAQKCAIILLVDDLLILDENYKRYVESIVQLEQKYSGRCRVFPVAYTKSFPNLNSYISLKNVIRAYDYGLLNSLGVSQADYIKSALLHEISRLMLALESPHADTLLGAPSPIRLFLSHSKHDSTLATAIQFKDFVYGKTQLKSFFDVHDIGFGYDFEEEIKKGIRESVLIVFQSDTYASREWCRIEAITAKAHNCPVVVVNALEKGEKRSFPYLGNVPTIRFNNDFQQIVDIALEKALYNLYQKALMTQMANLYGLDINFTLSNFPELFDIINIKNQMAKGSHDFAIVLYPDPPLGSEEMRLLNEMDDNLFFITPNQLPTLEIVNNG